MRSPRTALSSASQRTLCQLLALYHPIAAQPAAMALRRVATMQQAARLAILVLSCLKAASKGIQILRTPAQQSREWRAIANRQATPSANSPPHPRPLRPTHPHKPSRQAVRGSAHIAKNAARTFQSHPRPTTAQNTPPEHPAPGTPGPGPRRAPNCGAADRPSPCLLRAEPFRYSPSLERAKPKILHQRVTPIPARVKAAQARLASAALNQTAILRAHIRSKASIARRSASFPCAASLRHCGAHRAVCARAAAIQWIRVHASTSQSRRASTRRHSSKPAATGRAARAHRARLRASFAESRDTCRALDPAKYWPRPARSGPHPLPRDHRASPFSACGEFRRCASVPGSREAMFPTCCGRGNSRRATSFAPLPRASRTNSRTRNLQVRAHLRRHRPRPRWPAQRDIIRAGISRRSVPTPPPLPRCKRMPTQDQAHSARLGRIRWPSQQAQLPPLQTGAQRCARARLQIAGV